VDVMSKMRGVEAFARLWKRRTTIELPDGTICDLLSLPDLVQAKKTQRDKDWPMIRRLVEAHYFQHREQASPARIKFWLRELRTPELLIELTGANGALSRRGVVTRPLLAHAVAKNVAALEDALRAEEQAERELDRSYWLSLRRELERLRHARLKPPIPFRKPQTLRG
jgi:hypothetical protein